MAPTDSSPPITLPWQLKLLNRLSGLAAQAGLFELRTDAAAYLKRAQRRAGLSDFGPFDIETSLTHLLRTLQEETGLHLFGRIAANQLIERNLDNALQVQAYFKAHPELATVDVETPLIILCTPRTGSTLLHNLMALHPQARAPRLWELHRPCPPPDPASDMFDPRIGKSDREFGAYYRLIPQMRAIHYFAPTAVEECIHLFNGLFHCRTSFSTMANLSSYHQWIMQANMAPAYSEYKRLLQLLALNYPDQFLCLKSPAHLLCMDALAEVFPSARIVHIHRDPATAAGSFCSLSEAVQISMRRTVDPLAIGAMWNEVWTPAILDSLRWRDSGRLHILDVNFRDLVQAPDETVCTIYRHFDLPVPAALAGNIRQYLAEHPKDEFGSHHYTLERYGLNRADLLHEYQPYIERFEIPVETA